MAFSKNAAELPLEGSAAQATSHHFGRYSLFSSCLSWVVLALSLCLFPMLYVEPFLFSNSILPVRMIAVSFLILLGAVGGIICGHRGFLKGPSQRKAALAGLILGYLALLFLVIFDLLCTLFVLALPHLAPTHGL